MLREIQLKEAMRPLEGQSVAVVGNSADLLTQEWGQKIDKRDIVIRMNRAVPGYKDRPGMTAAIGKRCTILGCGNIDPVHEVLARCVPDYLWWFKYSLAGARHLSAVAEYPPLNKKPLFMWPGLLEGRLHDRIGAAPSSGIRIVHLLLEHARPREIALYGFGFWGLAKGSKSRVNWHSGGRAHEAHSPEKEFRYFLSLGFTDHGHGRWSKEL